MARSGNRARTVRRQTHTAQRYYDYNLLASVVLLTCFGLVMLYSTSAYSAQLNHGSDMFYFGKQAVISAVCLVCVVIFSQVDYHFYQKFAPWVYIAANILLFLTKFIGRNINGATRWIYIGPISFQPAEMGKVAIIMFLPYLMVRMGRNLKGFKAPGILLGFGALTSILTWLFTDNLSTAIIIAGITVGLLVIVHPKSKWFVIGGAGFITIVTVLLRLALSGSEPGDNFRLNRILVWISPEKFSQEGGHQVLQGLYAIGSGGFFGKGLGNSIQKLGAVPEAQNDMIFSIVCEELGIFGAGMLTLIFLFLLYRLLFIAQNAPDMEGSLIVSGIFFHISLQVILNIAVVLNVIPTTGITLPFVSYGGTSVLFLMIEMMLALSVSRQIKFQDEENIAELQAEYTRTSGGRRHR